jgi:N-acetylmuramoyl-L-alanine amidase
LPGFLVTVRRADAGKKGEPAFKPAPETKGTVIVDAGHGGHDRGAVIKGAVEAEVTLAVALELRKALKDLGYKVLLTRDSDAYKTLQERPKFASEKGGDVFVSLHCNSLAGSVQRLKSVTGYTVYILREGESEEDNALARRENQAIQEESGKSGKAEITPVEWILLEHQLNLYSKQSEALAESIVKGFTGFDIPRYSTGARQAGFFVLVGAYMPAVLFEMGFLTHDKDRRVMTSKSGQREIAKRMAKAIDQFRKRQKKEG